MAGLCVYQAAILSECALSSIVKVYFPDGSIYFLGMMLFSFMACRIVESSEITVTA